MKKPIHNTELSVLEFVQIVNKYRLLNKNNWYGLRVIVDNKIVRIKGYNTWLQVFTIDDIRQDDTMNISVAQFKQNLEKPFL